MKYILTSMYECQTPICALATALYPSALAIIRASGENSISLLSPLFKGRLKKRVNHGFFQNIDEVVVITYTSGHGFTGEEAFEIVCHGSLAIIDKILCALKENGFRDALPGEFTYRAYMNGKMDLAEAEAVSEIISSYSEKDASFAFERLTGVVSSSIGRIRNMLNNAHSYIELALNYGDDETDPSWAFPYKELNEIKEEIKKMLESEKISLLYKDGAKVVITGHTNAGKSSLFNAIVGKERALVSPIPGTTRDYIEANILLGDIPVKLYDTAGLREGAEEVEKMGIEKTKEIVKEADLILHVLDIDEKEEECGENKTIFLRSKEDITKDTSFLSFSSLTGEGLDDVIAETIAFLKREAKETEGPKISSKRQISLLKEALSHLESASDFGEEKLDLASESIKNAKKCLTSFTDEEDPDILSSIFSSFCVGK